MRTGTDREDWTAHSGQLKDCCTLTGRTNRNPTAAHSKRAPRGACHGTTRRPGAVQTAVAPIGLRAAARVAASASMRGARRTEPPAEVSARQRESSRFPHNPSNHTRHAASLGSGPETSYRKKGLE